MENQDPVDTRTNLGAGAPDEVEPDLLDFADLFFEDSMDGKARPLAEYLERFPRAEAAIAREWLRLMGAEEGAESPAPKADAGSKDRVGHYDLLKELGRGGQGAVWLAQDTRIQRKAAIKFMPQGFGLISEEKKGRFAVRRRSLPALNIRDYAGSMMQTSKRTLLGSRCVSLRVKISLHG